MRSLSFDEASPDRSLRALATDGEAWVAALSMVGDRGWLSQWDLEDGVARLTSDIALGTVDFGAAIAIADGRLIVAGAAELYRLERGASVPRPVGPLPVAPHRIATVRGSTRFAMAHGSEVFLGDVAVGSELGLVACDAVHSDSVRTVSVARDGRCVSTDYDGRTVLWSPTGARIAVDDDPHASWSCLDPNDETTVYVSASGAVHALRAEAGLPLDVRFTTQNGVCTSLLVDESGALVLMALVFPGQAESALWLFDRRSGACLRRIPCDARVATLAWAGSCVIGAGTPGGVRAFAASSVFERPPETRTIRRKPT